MLTRLQNHRSKLLTMEILSISFVAGFLAACGGGAATNLTAAAQTSAPSISLEAPKNINLDLSPVVTTVAQANVNPTGTPASPMFVAQAAVAIEPQITNHAGRVLGKMPSITAPVMFNTAEADAILSAMQIFPKSNAWNEDISTRPVLPNSDAMIAGIGANLSLRFNRDMGFLIVPPNQPKVPVNVVLYPDESDPGPFPIAPNTPIEQWPMDGTTLDATQAAGVGDRHAIIVDPINGKIYEFGETYKINGLWSSGVTATFDLNSNALRPLYWTSTDAAGLPIFPAIVRYDEVARGSVEHALRFTVVRTRKEFIYPATHYASQLTDPLIPAMGQRFRLKSTVNLVGLSPHALAVAKALQKYGMIVADNGGNWRISVAPDPRIVGLDDLARFKGSDFEVIQTTGATEGPRAP
jgi:hypothetical protein